MVLARPGEVITVFGRTCISDSWKRDLDDSTIVMRPEMLDDEKFCTTQCSGRCTESSTTKIGTLAFLTMYF